MTKRYRPAGVYQLRAPALPVSQYASPDQSVREGLSDPFFQTAVGIASPDLAGQFTAHRAGRLSAAKERRLRGSIFRYRARAALRPTPFGLFAGVAFGRIEEKTSIVLDAPAIR